MPSSRWTCSPTSTGRAWPAHAFADALSERAQVGRRASPFTHNHRTHRKVLLLDGQVGFTGGVGIAEEWDGDARGPDEWRDTQIRVRGPAVAGLHAAFVQNWSETAGAPDEPDDRHPSLTRQGEHTVQVVNGTATLGWDDMQTAWYALITAAQRRITLQTACFAPDQTFLDLVREVAARDVRVQLLLPGPALRQDDLPAGERAALRSAAGLRG